MAQDPILSKAMTLSYAGKVIARCTDFSLEVNKEVIDITTLQSAEWKEILVDMKSWSVSFNALATRGADATFTVYDELLSDVITNDTLVAVAIDDTGPSATIAVAGNGFLTAIPMNVAVGDKVTYSGTIEGSGALA